MITSNTDGLSSGRHSDEYSQQFEQLGSPSAESASKALRLGLLASADVDQRAVDFIRRALLIDQDGVRARLSTELKAASDVLFDRVGTTLLHVSAELFGKDVIQLFAQGGGLDRPLVASALSAAIAKDEIVNEVLEVLHAPEVQKLNRDCLTKSYSCLLSILTGVLAREEVRTSLLELAAARSRYVSAGALEILSGAIKDPAVASYFVNVVLSNRDVEHPLDPIGVLLEAPPLSDVIMCLAANICNSTHCERILERAGAYPNLYHVRKMLIIVASAAAWGADAYSYSFPVSMRSRAIEIIDQQLGLGKLNSDQFAQELVARLAHPSSTILQFVRERLNNKSIQQALIRGLSDEEGFKALWCANVLKQVCDQPEVRGQLLPAALDWPAGTGNLALEVLSGKHYSTLQEPTPRIGDRASRQPRLGSSDYRWEG